MNKILLAFATLIVLAACSQKPTATTDTGNKGDISGIAFEVAKNYFFKNNQEIPSSPKITTAEEFGKLFGMATTMGVNGSPRTDGNTFCCLKEIETQLKKYGVESEIVQIGRQSVRMCINCGGCRQNNGAGCVFDDDLCTVITEKMKGANALIVGTPVYYGQPNGGILSLMQRLFYSSGHLVQNKPAAAFAVCRRGGATVTLQTMNMMFEMMNMPVVTSQYWNIAYGAGKGEVKLDTEGMQTMRTLATNMAFLLQKIYADGNYAPQREERPTFMNFIR